MVKELAGMANATGFWAHRRSVLAEQCQSGQQCPLDSDEMLIHTKLNDSLTGCELSFFLSAFGLKLPPVVHGL